MILRITGETAIVSPVIKIYQTNLSTAIKIRTFD